MNSTASSLSELIAQAGSIFIDTRLVEHCCDLLHDTAFFIKDASGRYLVVNQSLVERHGLESKSQVLGRRPCDICPGDFGRIPTEQDAFVLRSGRPIVERLEMFWRKPHEPVWGLTSKFPLRGADGAVMGLIGISKDLSAPVPSKDVPPEIAQALRHLELAFGEPLSPSRLAHMAGLAPNRFARAVKRIFGITPAQLITKTRITAGARLLRETGRSIAEIALECGFTDHSAFTRAFRAVTQTSPIEYRRANAPNRGSAS